MYPSELNTGPACCELLACSGVARCCGETAFECGALGIMLCRELPAHELSGAKGLLVVGATAALAIIAGMSSHAL